MKLTRRFFLKSTGALAAYCGLAPLDSLALAAAPAVDAKPVTRGKTFVVIFLRGGADGLNLVVPWKESHYYEMRRGLAIRPPGEANGGLDLDGFFALHPRMKAMTPLFDSGLAVAAHAVGYDKNTRSHFEEQDVWETGVVGNTLGSDGWLNRHLQTSEGHGPLRAVAVGDTLPRILRGPVNAYAVRGLDQLTMPKSSGGDTVVSALEHAYKVDPKEHAGPARDLVTQTGRATLDGLRILQEVASRPDKSPKYPDTEVARRLHQVARMVKADIGLEVAEVDYNGWDTHQYQSYGGLDGPFSNLAGGLGDAMAAFAQDLGDRMDDVLVLTLSDFGRTAAENGTSGTDHGWASCMFAMGGTVLRASGGKARKVVTAKWPGLAPDQLHEGRDLLHTMDFRDVLAEAVRVHLGNPNLAKVLPGRDAKPVGLFA
ncbi:MAG: DUF1501 domain-containing protein [Planctomycetes bacterium]|nr:DUF1501 domain-containing protein [Planctomycetota bacterium]